MIEKTDERLSDRIKLVMKVSYITCVYCFAFSIVCFYVLNITEVIPYVFLGFGILNMVNIYLFKYHQNIDITYNVVSITALLGASVITLYSGSINSPFIFLLGIIVIAGYIITKSYGQLYLYLNLLIIVVIYSQNFADFSFVKNVVPEDSKNLFALLSVLFSVYLLGGVFGKSLLETHNKLFTTKTKLEDKINEKEILFKEVHHRVKNNLQTVSSLLSLHSRNIEDDVVKNVLKSSQNRVISMAMVHEMLYMREDLNQIDYQPYIKELSEYLLRSIKGVENNIILDIDIDDIKLNIDTSIPLGLLINEALTNSLKYGVDETNEGIISISIEKGENNYYILKIGDNGIGFSDSINSHNSKSLGLKLINNLTRQLQGSISRDQSKKGTHYIIQFKEIRDQTHLVH